MKLSVANVGSRCTTELSFAPLLTHTLESQLRREVAGFRRHISDTRLLKLLVPDESLKAADFWSIYDDSVALEETSRSSGFLENGFV